MSNLSDLKDACYESTLYDMDQRGFNAVVNYVEALEAENARLREAMQIAVRAAGRGIAKGESMESCKRIFSTLNSSLVEPTKE